MISVVIATFGDDSWKELAKRAARSVERQSESPSSVHLVHAESLHEARNQGAEEAVGDWLLFLDADDEIDDRYLEFMMVKVNEINNADALIQPATLGVYPNGSTDDSPVVIPAKNNILDGNHMVIGTLVRRDTFLKVGGFKDFPFWEDWELWIRCVKNGSLQVIQDKAIYRVHVNDGGRNLAPSRNEMNALFKKIRKIHG